MSWVAVVVAIFQFAFEILKLINRNQEKADAAEKERVKQSTEAIQSGVRGVIDRDESRIRAAFERVRDLRK